VNNIVVSDNIKIENMIYEIRGKKVMLDSDLAKLYNVETKRINEAVKNNIEKFPERYCFKLSDNESDNLLVEIFDQKIEKRGGKYKNPRVFTEQGVYMLATILKSKEATKITIAIMDAFVVMKNIINTSLIEQKYFNELTIKNTEDIKLLQESFDKLNTKESNNHIFYEGQIYDAYSLLIDILSKAKKEIIIIDNYAGKKLFDIIRNINVKVKIYTENIDNISKEKYEKQYSNIEIINTNIFHDRFIIIDNKVLYHSGASFKDLGKKCFAITKIVDNNILEELLNKLKKCYEED
jgi:prophage antirepressor-like protein